MIIDIYSVKDVKAGRFLGLNLFPGRPVAIRAFGSAVNSKEGGNLLSDFPEDAQIYKLGEFNDESGEISYAEEFIMNATELKRGE